MLLPVSRSTKARHTDQWPTVIRAISAVEPTNDPDGKYNMLVNTMIGLMGSAPVLDDELYRMMSETNKADNVENKLTEAGYYLYDDASIAIDLLTRLMALKATTGQLATMAATIAADGLNPINRQRVFDGANAKYSGSHDGCTRSTQDDAPMDDTHRSSRKSELRRSHDRRTARGIRHRSLFAPTE